MGRPWTNEQDEYIKANYATASEKVMIAHIGKSWDSIKVRAQRLQVYRNRSELSVKKKQKVAKTRPKDELLRFSVLMHMMERFKKRLPNVTTDAIIDKTFSLIATGKMDIDRLVKRGL